MWQQQPVRTDLQEFLVGHLTSPAAAEAPLVVLGQPGSGKSMLAKVLAARLPASDFVAVQVPLREVAADSDVQTQIEQGLRISTGEQLPWRDFVGSAGDAVPVVLLDGFDELLQATKVSQSNFLKRIARFQQREADLQHPVIVVVTSRVSVADRARPASGMVSLLLEPFDDGQIEQWLGPWRRLNDTALTVDVLRPHACLARQPLLLLLLAIYDRTECSLREHGDAIGQIQLYEGLLAGFAKREVLKQHADESDDEVTRLVEHELVRLSVAAFAMFNRGQQWVTADELDADLTALPVGEVSARVVISSFYFIHTAQALRQDNLRLRTYEFMHPTFGEYLIARLTVRELLALADGHRDNDDFLHALLSFASLTARRTVLTFIGNIVMKLPARGLQPMRDTLLSLFHAALLPRSSALLDYQPGSALVPRRCAAYSANLCVLLVTGPSFEVTTDQLFPGFEHPVGEWTRTATFWLAQLSTEGRQGLEEALKLSRHWQDGRRVVRITSGFNDLGARERNVDLYWSYRIHLDRESRSEGGYYGWIRFNFDALARELEFLCSAEGDTVAHALAPFADDYGTMITTLWGFGDGRPFSAANALMTLWLKAGSEASGDELAAAYDPCMRYAVHGFAPDDSDTRRKFRLLFLHQLQVVRDRLPLAALDRTVREMLRTDGPEVEDKEDLLTLTRAICPKLLP
ncbi:AAA family ATPase [Amycolatopsis sp. NPDC024027]|uniref:NACHT domain-containing protein n=1 Tax=Amycolatopsis sp. NPDC024027 TaxID=3154327 RepID=UPI0033D19675